MTYREFVEVVKAWGLVTPGINDQDIYNIRIDTDGVIRISLEESVVEIKIT